MTTYPHEAYVPGVTPTLSDIWREVEKLEATSRYAADVPPIVAEGLVTETRYQGVERAAIELFRVLRQKAEAKLLAQFALGPLRGRATFVTNPDVLGDVGFVDLASTDFLDELGNVILDASVGARIAIGFDLPDPALAAIVRDHLSALGAFGENLRSRVAKWLIDGLNKGMGVEDMVEALPKSSPLSENAARTLARTEAVAAGNASATASWEAAGIGGFKRWLSARDNRVRDDHVDADGQTVPMDQDFEVCGGQRAHYPGDPSLSVDCRINCRCTVTYRTADGQDLEIPRTRNQLQKVARARGLATSGSNTQLRRRLLNATRQEKLEAGVAPEDLTRRELLERATSAGIRGRAKMSKDQLIDELRRRKAFAVVELPQGHNMAFPVRHDPATGKYLPAGAGVSGSGSQADPYAVDARVPPHYPRGTHPLHFDFTGLARKAQQENTAEDFRGLFEAEYFEDPSIPATNWDLDTVTMRQVRNATKQVRAATTQALEGRGIGGGDSYVRVWRAGDVPDPGKPGSPNGPGDPFPSFSWSPRDLFGEPKPYLVQASDVWGDVDAINPGQSLLESEVILRPGSAVAERAQATVLNGQSFPVRHDPGTGKYLPADGGGGAKKAKKAKKPARAKPAHAKPTSDGSPIKAVGPAKTATRGGGLPFPKEPVNITGPDGKPVMRYDDAGAVPTTSYESSTGEMLGDVSHSDGWTEATRVWRANGRRKPTAAEAKEGYRYGVVTVGPSRPTKAEAEADMYGWLTKGKKAPGFDQPDAGTAAESTDPARQKVTDALSEHYGPWETRNLRTLVGYTDDGHRLMNARLRAGEKDPRAVKLDRALAKAGPLPEAMTVERRTEAPVFAGMKPGTVSRDRAFLSTSADTSGWGPARPGQVTAHIALPKGTRAAYIGDASYAPVEYEVLVGRGSHLRFDRRKGDDVFLTLVKQDPVL
jgi:hypothetical protein